MTTKNLDFNSLTPEERAVWQGAFMQARADGKSCPDACYEADAIVRQVRDTGR